jgi:proteasome lid subunit RPN8/RPN11
MTPELLGAIFEHANNARPRESCGLLVSAPESLAVYIPCRNIAEGSEEFNIHPEDWVSAEDAGRILGVVHSHPNGTPSPSKADTEYQKRTQVPWWIVVPGTSEWRRFGASPTEGRTFAWGVEDCYSILQDVFTELPDFARRPYFWRERNLIMDGLALAGFIPTKSDPMPNDVLIFAVGSDIPNHLAVYVGDGKILHHSLGSLSIIEPVGKLIRNLIHTVRRY